MLIQRANKCCAEPAPYQAQAMGQWVGARRLVYNIAQQQRTIAQEQCIDAWRKGVRLDDNKPATACREMAEWRGFAAGHALQHVEEAFARFRSGQDAHPKPGKTFKNDPFTLPGEDAEFRRLNKNGGAIKLPRIGEVRDYRRLRSVTFRRKAGKWYVCVAPDKEIADPPKCEAGPIGIDRGIEALTSLSTGERIDLVNAGKPILDKRAKMQRRLARKQKHCASGSKVKGKIARLDHRAANVRRDFAKVEDLRIANMSATAKGTIESPGKNVAQKNGLDRSILDQVFTGYKLEERGGLLEFLAAPYTSRWCPLCRHVRPENRHGRDFCCLACGFAGHADVVAAINISQARALTAEPPKRIRKRVVKRKQLEFKHAA